MILGIDDDKDLDSLDLDILARTARGGKQVLLNIKVETLYLDHYLDSGHEGIDLLLYCLPQIKEENWPNKIVFISSDKYKNVSNRDLFLDMVNRKSKTVKFEVGENKLLISGSVTSTSVVKVVS